jgi:hypothetical protein
MKEESKKVIRRITLEDFSDGSFKAHFEGCSCRAEVLPLLKKCDRIVKTRLSGGASLGEKDSKIESLSPAN